MLCCAGLSDRFITFDDDVFLTAPFSQQDFVAPDGGQHLTGKYLQQPDAVALSMIGLFCPAKPLPCLRPASGR